jgi:plasmid stabilization system protein ParE
MRVRYTRQALADLVAIADYIGERNPKAAVKVETAIRSSIDLLADFPRLGRDRPDLEARALGIPRYSYTPTIASKTRRSGSSIFVTTGESRWSRMICNSYGCTGVRAASSFRSTSPHSGTV